MARCDYCGRHYDERAYQVVIQSATRFGAVSHRSFDTVDCAVRGSAAFGQEAAGRRAWMDTGDETTLARLEQTVAELFMARTELEEERRLRRDLERQTIDLLGERDRAQA